MTIDQQQENLDNSLPDESLDQNKPKANLCATLTSWTIYYITLAFALLAIFRYDWIYLDRVRLID
jgi:hypothetical protein